jgi:rhodanese-related sulfurtransferase
MIRSEVTTTRWRALTALGLALACGQAAAPPGGQQAAPATIAQEELLERLEGDAAPLVLDVRTPGEFSRGHVPGAVNVPHDALAGRLSELGPSREREIVVYCESGRRAGLAEETLREAGFTEVRQLEGSMSAWRDAALPCEGC